MPKARWRRALRRLRSFEPAWPLWLPLLAVLVLALLIGRSPRAHYPRAAIVEAIRLVESGGDPAPPDGDAGLAIGPLQIHRAYWEDAVEYAPALGGRYEDCRDRAYAEDVLAAYMERWVPQAWRDGDAEVVARTHNGGPLGAHKDATLRYWRKVRAQLMRLAP